MATNQRSNWVQNIWPVAGVVLALLALILGSGFFYNNVWNVTDLRYNILPEYSVGSRTFAGVVVENRGRQTAEGVWIKSRFARGVIEEINIISDEPYEIREGAKPGDASFALWLDRLIPGSSITVYLVSTQGPGIGGTITVTWRGGRGTISSAASQNVLVLVFLSFALGLGLAVGVFILNRMNAIVLKREVDRLREL